MLLSFCKRKKYLRAALTAVCLMGGAVSVSLPVVSAASAQAITDSQLAAARKVIAAIHATDQFDSFLPDTALDLKNELSQRDPNLADVISKTVDEQTMLLIPRRTDLEKEVARVYAKHFTEAELNDIAKFYNSPAGKKLLKEGPNAMAESVGAFEIWRQGVAQDLAVNVGKALDKKLAGQTPVAGAQPLAVKAGAKSKAPAGLNLNMNQ